MQSVKIKVPAKLNLALEITGVENKGYHLMNMVMQTVSLFDYITITQTDTKSITISCTDDIIPCDEKNICYKCAAAFFEHAKILNTGIHIHIQKHIPQQAGMAGGSADGAGVLVGLNEMFGIGLSKSTLCSIGKNIGADIPFCIKGGTALVQGIGEVITKIKDIPDCDIVIAKPKLGISTKKSFRNFDKLSDKPDYDINNILNAIDKGDIELMGKYLYNDLELVCDINDVSSIKNIMLNYRAKGAVMTGSGSAVFGIFTNRGKAFDCQKRLSERYNDCFLTKPVNYGATLINE